MDYMQIIRNLLFSSEITVLLGAERNPCGAGARSTLRCSTAESAVLGARVAHQAAGTTIEIPFQKLEIPGRRYSTYVPITPT